MGETTGQRPVEWGSKHTYFTYDAAGQRVRKVYEHDGIVEERIYLSGYELYRRRAGVLTATVQVERQTLHVMDDTRRVALVETKTVDTLAVDAIPVGVARWRYQLDNHLGSSALELSEAAAVISYEEYHPYGTTAFHSTSGAVSQKRYRYTGKEKDDETGLYYHGARYYAPWLGRWTAADPAGMVDGLNLYRYSRDNPIVFSDPGGTQSENEYSSGPNELILQGTYVDNGQVIARYGAFDGEFVYEEIVGEAPTPAPAPKEPAKPKPKPAPVKEAAPAAEGDQGSIGEQFLRGAVLGDYGGEPTAASIVGQVAVGFTPLGVAPDVRDFTAALGDYRAGKEGAGLNLVLAGVGFLPFGDLAKIARKGDNLLKAGADIAKNLDKADEVVEAASRMNSSNALSGVERASDELLESVGRKFRRNGSPVVRRWTSDTCTSSWVKTWRSAPMIRKASSASRSRPRTEARPVGRALYSLSVAGQPRKLLYRAVGHRLLQSRFCVLDNQASQHCLVP